MTQGVVLKQKYHLLFEMLIGFGLKLDQIIWLIYRANFQIFLLEGLMYRYWNPEEVSIHAQKPGTVLKLNCQLFLGAR
jgi:hypothetical protein